MAEFYQCNHRNIKVDLNSEIIPYDNLNINFSENQFATLYKIFPDKML